MTIIKKEMNDNRQRASSAPAVILQIQKRPNLFCKPDKKYDKVLSDKGLNNTVMVKFKGSDDLMEVGIASDTSAGKYYSKLRTLSLMPNNDIRRPSLIQQGKEKLELHICRIYILLVMMQLGLGGSMAALGLYLHNLSPVLTLKDCPYWAAFPLLFTGCLGLYFCSSEQKVFRPGILSMIFRNICAIFSVICALLCAIASGLSGHHGNWLAYYSASCPVGDQEDKTKHASHNHPTTSCCKSILTENSEYSICECGYYKEIINSTTIISFNEWNPLITYRNVNCYYVFSALKDYLILQCALYAVAAGVSIWLSVLIWSQKIHDRNKNIIITRNSYARRRIKAMQEYFNEENDDILNYSNHLTESTVFKDSKPKISIDDANFN